MSLIWRYELICDACGRKHEGAYKQLAGTPPMTVVTEIKDLSRAIGQEPTQNQYAADPWYTAATGAGLSYLCLHCAKAYLEAGIEALRVIWKTSHPEREQ